MTPRDWVVLFSSVLTLAGVLYAAHRTGQSSDRAVRASKTARRENATWAANGAENSAFTRAKAMIADAAEAQQKSFDSAVKRMERQIADMQQQLDRQDQKITAQATQIATQHSEIATLQRERDADRRVYVRYIRKLLDLLEHHQIVYPVPPPFFDQEG